MNKYSILFSIMLSGMLHAAPIEQLVRQDEISELSKLSLDELNAHGESGMNALHYAAFFGKHEIVQILIERGVNLDTCDLVYGANAFELALMLRQFDCAAILFNAMKDDFPDMLLHQPLRFTIADMINLQPEKVGRKFLMDALACAQKNLKLPAYQRMLLSPKYYFSISKTHRLTKHVLEHIHRLCITKNKRALQDLLKSFSPLEKHYAMFAVLGSDKGVDMLKVAVESTSNIDFCTQLQQTALIHACWDENEAHVDFLLSQHADVNHVCIDEDRTPLIYIAQKGNLRIAKKLIDAGADPNAVTSFNVTPFMTAARWGHTALMEYLLPFSDINAASTNGETALMFAINFGHVRTVKSLMNFCADVSLRTRTNITALHIAANGEDLVKAYQMLKLLLDAPTASINASDDRDRTPLFVAILSKNVQVVRLLIERGADVLWTTPDGNFTYLDVAADVGGPEIYEIIRQARQARGT